MPKGRNMGASVPDQALVASDGAGQAVSTLSGFDPSRLIATLQSVQQNALFRGSGSGVDYAAARALGFVQEHVVTKPCKCCGAPQTDYRYAKLTIGGQAYLALAIATEARRAATVKQGAVHEGAGPQDIAQGPQ